MSHPESASEVTPTRRDLKRRRRAHNSARRRRQFQALAAGGLVLGVGASATLAAWTDQTAATGQFEAGAFAIEANIDGVWQGTNEMTFDAAAMYPSETRTAAVYVRTTTTTTVDGELTLTGAGSSDALAAHLQYRAVATVVARNETITCNASSFTGGNTPLFGTGEGWVPMNHTATAQTVQPLSAASTDAVAYCFQVRMSPDAPNDAQGLSAEHTWSFLAESVLDD